MLKKGQGYIQTPEIIIQSVYYGFSNYFTAGYTTSLLTLYDQINEGDFFPTGLITSKFGDKITKKFYLAGGLYAYLDRYKSYPDKFYQDIKILPYLAGTLGNHKNHFTALFLISIDNYKRPGKAISFNGQISISKRIKLVVENWLNYYERFYLDHYHGINYPDAPKKQISEMYNCAIFKYISQRWDIGLGIIKSYQLSPNLYNNKPERIPYIDFLLKFQK